MLTQSDVKSLTLSDFKHIFENYHHLFPTTPMTHQYASILWAMIDRTEGMFLHGIGTGKTLASLYTTEIWRCNRILVVSPTSVMKTWKDQIQEHTKYTYALLNGTGEQRRAKIKNDFSKFHIINYEGLKTVFGKKTPVTKRGKVTGSRFVPDINAICLTEYDALIFDECHRLANFDSLQTKISYRLGHHVQKILMLTGTPMAKDIRDFWSELMVLNDGETLGDDPFVFKHTYMKQFEMSARGNKFAQWYPKPDAIETIVEKISHVAIRYDTAECCDLPDLVEEKRHVDMSEEQKKATKAILGDLKAQLEMGHLDVKNVINKASKLAQVGSGMLIGDEGEVTYLKSNPKIDELISLIHNEIPGKCIIYHNFVAVGRMIEERFRKANIKFRSCRGETKNKEKQIDDFQHNDDVRALIAHPQSGGEGLNLQMAHVVVFLDQIYAGSTLREQCIGRVWRKGQELTCVIIDLMINDPVSHQESIDDRIHASAITKKDLAKSILDWIRDL